MSMNSPSVREVTLDGPLVGGKSGHFHPESRGSEGADCRNPWISLGSRRERGSPAWTRTKNLSVNSRLLCQLSYRGRVIPNQDNPEIVAKDEAATRTGTGSAGVEETLPLDIQIAQAQPHGTPLLGVGRHPLHGTEQLALRAIEGAQAQSPGEVLG